MEMTAHGAVEIEGNWDKGEHKVLLGMDPEAALPWTQFARGKLEACKASRFQESYRSPN